MGLLFSKCPTWWVKGDEFLELRGGGNTGVSLAALKCAMAISVGINFHTCKVRFSYSDLEKLTGLSRPMISSGIEKLERLGVVIVCRKSYINEYQLVEKEGEGWAKLPVHQIRKNLHLISNRGVAPLTGLKIYMTILALRPNSAQSVSIGYDKLREYTGVQKAAIRSGLDVLYSNSLIHTDPPNEERKSNVYTVLGISAS